MLRRTADQANGRTESVRAVACAVALLVAVAAGAQDKERGAAPARSAPTKGATAPAKSGDVEVGAIVARLVAAPDSKDFDAALGELRRLADRGSAKAAFVYGRAAAEGRFMAADPVLAERYLRRAANAGNADAQHALAVLLLASTGRERDQKEAIDLLRRSAAAIPESVYMLALVKARMSQDAVAAERQVVAAAAEAGFAPAQYRLGADMLREPPDKAQDAVASQWLQRASDQGQVLATFDLATLYLEGTRIERDTTKGIELLEKASRAGLSRAEYALGRAYMLGEGVAVDHDRGATYIRRAAAKGYAQAEYAMGFAHTNGVGEPVDEAKALEWFRRAAQHGNVDALFAIGTAYSNGYGVTKDPVRAIEWYCKAALAGHKEGIKMVQGRPGCRLPPSAK
jgi:TPR repeat protein